MSHLTPSTLPRLVVCLPNNSKVDVFHAEEHRLIVRSKEFISDSQKVAGDFAVAARRVIGRIDRSK